MQTLTVKVTGETRDDIEQGLDEVKRLVAEGYIMGCDSNDTGRFYFDLEKSE